MTKYDSIKYLKETKARKDHVCDRCGEGIKAGEIYFKESIERIKTLGLTLRSFCIKCYKEHGEKLIIDN